MPSLAVKGTDNQWDLEKGGRGSKEGNNPQEKPFSLGQRNGQPSKTKDVLAENCSVQIK